jgi:hypothetical protein
MAREPNARRNGNKAKTVNEQSRSAEKFDKIAVFNSAALPLRLFCYSKALGIDTANFSRVVYRVR